MRTSAHLVVLLGTLLSLGAGEITAQSITAGSVAGIATDEAGEPVVGASVLLRSPELGLARAGVTDGDGGFEFSFVIPGSYQVLVEALGHRPALLAPVLVTAGRTADLAVVVQSTTGPVTRIDTLVAPSADAPRWNPGTMRVGARAIDGLPDLFNDLGSVAALTSLTDDALGIVGLPGSLTEITVDGIPFRTVRHPAVRGEALASPLLARSLLSRVEVVETPADVEWGGTTGGLLAVSTRAGTRAGGAAELEGSWSGDALWSSTEQDFETPGLQSAWGAGRVGFALARDTSRIFLAGDAFRTQLPLAPRLSAAAAATLTELDGALVSTLTSPALEEVTRVSGLARLDWWLAPDRRFALRAAAGRLERTFDGPSRPTLGYGLAAPETSTDFAVGADLLAEYPRDLTLEVRGGLTGSSRTFADGRSRGEALLPGPGLMLGDPSGLPGEASRIDFTFATVAHWERSEAASLKGGVAVRAARHTVSHSADAAGRFVFADPAEVAFGPGSLTRSTTPESAFSTSELSAYVQYGWEAARGLVLSAGGRADYESIPTEADLNSEWFDVSGLRNDEHPTNFFQVGARVGARWDVLGDGRATLVGAATLQHGDVDPAALHQLYSQDGATSVTRTSGNGVAWPEGGGGADSETAASLALFGPDMRAPRTSQLGAGLVVKLTSATSVYLGGTVRRTDFVPRRRNLNRSVVPFGVDASGRDIFGDLVKEGAVVQADGRSNRRFAGLDDVWALDPDGWSEYRGATVGVDHRGRTLELFATYTRSRTEDNWFGAASGHPDAALDPRVPVAADAPEWAEGISDFDVPHRFVAGGALRLAGLGTLGATYRYRSSLPFTPGYRAGVDVNGDGSALNDAAGVPDAGALSAIVSAWPCLDDMLGGFAIRNGCRGEARQSLDARLSIGLGRVTGQPVSVVVDALNLVESSDGYRDTALLLVDPDAPLAVSDDGTTTTIPTTVNGNFGSVLLPSSPGRVVRIGLRIGG